MENHEIPKEDMLARMEYALRLTGLGGLESRNPVMLSGGQKQRLAIAGAIAAGAKYLIMDEPSSMLDPDGKREMRELLIRLKSEGLGILLISHHPDEIEICDSYYVLDRGNVWFYSDFKQLKASPVYSKLGYDPGESEILELLMGVL
jgi:energy-coupling factor transport system ATP-binding protein